MCISAGVLAGAALVSSAVGTKTSIDASNRNAKNAAYTNRIETKQRIQRMQMEELAAMEEESTRYDEFQRTRSSAMAAIGASGLSENISFDQGIDPEQWRALERDVRNSRLGLVSERASMADSIRVGARGVKIAKSNARSANIGAIADFASSAINAANFYQTYKPAKGTK